MLELLNHPDAASIERIKLYEIWHLLLLVKWTIIYGRSIHRRHLIPATKDEVHGLLNLTKDLGDNVREFQSRSDVYLWMRNLAFQQFWIQRKAYLEFDVARQYLLFGTLDKNHAFQQWFKGTAGVSMLDFLELSWGLFVRVLADKQWSVTESYFSGIADRYEDNTVSHFLHAFSHSVLGARAWLHAYDAEVPESVRGIEYEYFAPTPFARYPLIRHYENYYVISPDLLLNCLTELVYDLLKADYGGEFMNRFGRMFEDLVGKSIRSLYEFIITESDLKRHFKNRPDQRLVDYIIVDDECNIFIEAKAVTMSLRGMVTDLSGTVRSQTKPVLQGIEQAYAVAQTLTKDKEVCGVRIGDRKNYLIIVTFKDLFLGNGQLYRDQIAPAEIEKVIANSGGEELIPLSNVFVVSIDDFDALLGNVLGGRKSLADQLESAASRVRASEDWISFPKLVTAGGVSITMLPYLESASNELYHRIKDKLKP